MIFDCLVPLHQLVGRDRLLLECAGMLHDIGWVSGARRHNVRSARLIFMDESLPLDMIDRIVLGLLAGAHRGRVTIESHPLFHLLAQEERTKVLRLAAILRMADGLDGRHTGSVLEIQGVIGSRDVTFSLSASGDVTEEKIRAQSRGNLFVRVFERGLVFA
jgi:exopolyphosphatase/guanosine-5'-triphosphate,3'-diphosphate pyrophosphatase